MILLLSFENVLAVRLIFPYFFSFFLCVKSTGKVGKQWTTENKGHTHQITNFSNKKPEKKKKNDVGRRAGWDPFNFLFTCSPLCSNGALHTLVGGLHVCIPFFILCKYIFLLKILLNPIFEATSTSVLFSKFQPYSMRKASHGTEAVLRLMVMALSKEKC